MAFLLIFGIISMIFMLCLLRKSNTKGMKDLLCCVCVWSMICLICVAWFCGTKQITDFQYVPAEYIAENKSSTYFGTEDGNIFYVDRLDWIDPDVPYLLGMDTHGTRDVTDDEILTVWKLCE